MQRIDYSSVELKEKLIKYNPVTKVVKGGKNNRWDAIVVVGDENGHVGIGIGKAIEMPEAHRKAVQAAKKKMITVPRHGTTIPHRVIGELDVYKRQPKKRLCRQNSPLQESGCEADSGQQVH